MTLTSDYLSPSSARYNFTYSVPVSKYMPDDFVQLIFRPIKTTVKEVEHCYNYDKKMECVFGERPSKIDEKRAYQNGEGTIFEVNTAGFRSKRMTYRMSLRHNQVRRVFLGDFSVADKKFYSQNTCKLSASKLGNEFVEYNFNFYRLCDD